MTGRHFSLAAEAKPFPQMGNRRAMMFVALTAAAMTLSVVAGTYAILLFYALWLPYYRYKGRLTLTFTKDVFLYYCFVALCVLSVVWSDYKSSTLRGSLEYTSMVLCSIIIARIVSLKAFNRGLAIGATCVLLTAVLLGGFEMEGIFGSKNQAGFLAEVGIFVSGYCFFTSRRLTKVIFLATFLVCMAAMVESRSATSTASLAVTIAISAFAYVIIKLPRKLRSVGLSMTLLVGFFLAVILLSVDWQSMVFSALGKDATLTGRTYLWAQGYKIGLEAPFIGHGYNAFWVIGQPRAERYWYEFSIFTRTGFHFHNLFIEVFVELGVLGALLVISMFVAMLIGSWRYLLKYTDGKGVFLLGLTVMMLIRAFTEVDFFQQYGLGQILFFSILPRLAAKPPLPTEHRPKIQ